MADTDGWNWDPVDSTPPTASKSVPGGRRLKRIAAVVAVCALLAAGAGVGQFVWPRQVVVQEIITTDYTPEPETIDEINPMPNVNGMPEGDARAAVVDAGFTSEIGVIAQPAAGPEGTVIGQEPLAGAELGETVTLITATPVEIPDLVGLDQREAQLKVEELGGAAQIKSVVDATHQTGTVVASIPEAGEQMPQIVQLQVSTGGVARLLTDVRDVESSNCRSKRELLINGQRSGSALVCEPSSRRDHRAWAHYAVSRKAGYLRFTLGIPDDARNTSATGRVQIVADGTPLMDEQVGYGKSQQYTVPLHDALRLEITVTANDEDAPPEVAFGDVSLIGLASDLDQLP